MPLRSSSPHISDLAWDVRWWGRRRTAASGSITLDKSGNGVAAMQHRRDLPTEFPIRSVRLVQRWGRDHVLIACEDCNEVREPHMRFGRLGAITSRANHTEFRSRCCTMYLMTLINPSTTLARQPRQVGDARVGLQSRRKMEGFAASAERLSLFDSQRYAGTLNGYRKSACAGESEHFEESHRSHGSHSKYVRGDG